MHIGTYCISLHHPIDEKIDMLCNLILYYLGGFQMVSLLKLAQITEEGVKFRSPYDDSECMLTPEHSMEIQVR